MTPKRFFEITGKYSDLRVVVVGDFCLDRYLEIDPARNEISIETGLVVHNVVKVRSQPGGAGTVLNNLCALGVGKIFPVGFSGDDGEGYELRQAMTRQPGVCMDYFFQTPERHTFTYCKPLIVEPGEIPREQSRLDQKNWTPTPAALSEKIGTAVSALANQTDALILLSQVDKPETGVLTESVLKKIGDFAGVTVAKNKDSHLILADSRHSLREFPPVTFKMNATELAELTGTTRAGSVQEISAAATALARRNNRPVFVTLAERGIIGALPDGAFEHSPSLPVRGEIDIVGAGDAVTANLVAGLAAGATLREALDLANAAASIVIHQLGTTGTASVTELQKVLFG